MVTVPGSTSLNLSKGMTLEAWVNAASLSSWRSVLLKERTNGLSYSLYATDPYNSPSGPSAFINTGGSDQSGASPTALAPNTWTHLAATYDGSTLRYYVNGVLKASQKLSGSIVTSGGALRIGGNKVWGEYFQGTIDDVRIYNQALTQSAIQTDMNTAVAGGSTTTSTTPQSVQAPPTASAGPAQTAAEGAKVTFQGSGTGTGLSYSWDFGDGTAKAATASATHAYADNGSYTATLTVTDSSGQTATSTAAVTVTNVAPTATFSGPASVTTGSTATFSFANPSDPSPVDTAKGFTYSYDFNNDGTFEVANSASPSASTTFATAGTYTVRGRITDKDGGATDYTTTVIVAAPSATTTTSLWSSSAKPTVASDPDTNAVEIGVKFTSDVAGSITGLRFYKGSGNTGTHVGHLWDSSGNLLATVTFTGESASGWQTATFSSPVAIKANTTYVASYFAPNGHYAGDNNYFATSGVNNGVLHAPSGNNGVYHYGSSGGFPTDTYLSSNYWVDVVFSSSSGSSTGTPASNSPPTASAGPAQTAAEGAKVTFQGSGTGTGLSYSWDFGDGTAKAATATATHAYANQGSYAATLTVTDSSGQTATSTAAVTVTDVAPTATFSGPASVAPGASATFSFANPSSPSPADTAAGFTYSYDFNNDGTFEVANSASPSASTTFATAGTYTVRGRISDQDGASTDYTTTVTVGNSTSNPAALRTFYVDPNGSDSAAGTSASPWKTLQHAADSVQAGDQVIVRAGNYAGFIMGWDAPTAGTAANRITFLADPTAAAGSVVINARNSKTACGIDLEPGCDYITISGFTIQGAGGIATYPNKGSGIKVTGNYDSVINNTVTNLDYGFGIFADNANGVLIQGNTVSGTGNHNNGDYGHGIYLSGSTDGAVVRGNVIHDNSYIGIHVNGDLSEGGNGLVTNALIEDNLIYNNGQNGINADGLQSSTIRNNLIYGFQGFGIALYQIDAADGSKGNVIVNNTIVSNVSGAAAALRIIDGSTGNTVLNNVLLGADGNAFRISSDSLSGLVSDYNAGSSSYQSEDTGATQTAAQWQAQTGQDKHSVAATASALFVNAAGNNYHLSSTSPAIDKGTTTDAPSTDLDGNARPNGNGVDIGAYEF
jgi:PKD repeat protein